MDCDNYYQELINKSFKTNHENIFTFSHLLDRVQMENEWVSDFGYSLIEIAKIALPKT